MSFWRITQSPPPLPDTSEKPSCPHHEGFEWRMRRVERNTLVILLLVVMLFGDKVREYIDPAGSLVASTASNVVTLAKGP